MRDPYPPLPDFLKDAIRPYCEKYGLYTLPNHLHEVVFFFLLYHSINVYFAPRLSQRFFASTYNSLNRRTRINWNVHVVSLVQSVFISFYALYAMYADEERQTIDRVWGYSGFLGTVQAAGAGYFLWDLLVSTQYIKIFGFGLLAHAISALLVFFLGFRPFVNYYAPDFLLYELSSPFLNIHWFMDKLNMTGSTAQLVNGICLLTTFFGCRLIWGNYASLRVGMDVYLGWRYPPLHIVEQGRELPSWLVFTYLGSNLVLNSLNVFWLSRMIATLRKRFEAPPATTTTTISSESKAVTSATEVDQKSPIVNGNFNTTGTDLKDLIEKNLVNVSMIDGEDDKVLVEGIEVEVPIEIVRLVEQTAEGLRQRRASLTG